MVVLGINNEDYRVVDSWSEITVKKARELTKIANTAPEELLTLYKEQSKGKEVDEDQIKLLEKELATKQDELHTFYCNILECLGDVPTDIIEQTNKEDLKMCYQLYLFPFVFGALHYPINQEYSNVESFTTMGETYYASKEREIMNFVRPLCDEETGVFCDASDLDSNGRKMEGGRYEFAELITAIIYRKEEEKYTEKQSMEVANYYQDILTCDVYHGAMYHLSKTNEALKTLFPNLYQGGDVKSSSASTESGLADFGWLNSIMTVAEMGILTKEGLTPLESVRQTNLYDFMTILSKLRATSDFQRIYSEKQKK